MTERTNTCTVCLHWIPVTDEDGSELGQCRRFPPSYEGWSMTFAHDWCGEFRNEDA